MMKPKDSRIIAKWGGYQGLVKQFTAVSSYFLHNYHRLKPHEGADGLNSTEAMFLVQLMDFKWDEKDPHPSLGTIAKRMGLSRRHVRNTVKKLEDLKYLNRVSRGQGNTSSYDLKGLFEKLNQMQIEDAQQAEIIAEGGH